MKKFNNMLIKDREERKVKNGALQSDRPSIIYHYTNTDGLLGILSSSRFWATDYRFLNDKSEVTYTFDLFADLVRERMENNINPCVDMFLDRTLKTVNLFDGMFDFYITCFCEDGDVLTQWRSYTHDINGYAVGVNTGELGSRPRINSPNQELYLRKVIYCRDKQVELLSDALDSVIAILEVSSKELGEKEINLWIAKCCQHLRGEVGEYFMTFKHPAFYSEREWRLCHVVASHEESLVKYRSGPYGLTPYIEIDPTPMVGVNSNKIPLVEVKYGPTNNQENVELSLKKLLRSKKYAFTGISGSTLPVRV